MNLAFEARRNGRYGCGWKLAATPAVAVKAQSELATLGLDGSRSQPKIT